jgi:thiol:disulfide interchange protein DsbC
MLIKARGLLAGAGVVVLAAWGTIAVAQSLSKDAVMQKLKERMPKTEITSVDCEMLGSFCEIVAGNSVFYTDAQARYLIVGRVYDLQERRDLTAARLLDLNPSALLAGAARPSSEEGEAPAASPSPRGVQRKDGSSPNRSTKVDVSQLSDKGAVRWGSGSREVTIFTDFRCGYCKLLVRNLEAMNVRVIERPISVLGTRMLSEAVICSSDRRKAMRAAYDGQELASRPGCDTSGLNENERFAAKHGFTGTPVVVRSDGAVSLGYRDRQTLEQWLNGGA